MSVQELFDLDGKVAIVTGGGSGIGRQMAQGLAEAGADLVLCARKLERVRGSSRELPTRALALPVDVTRPGVRRRDASPACVHEFGRVDILVNNAGTVWGAPPEDIPLKGWQKVVDVNLTGVFLCAQAVGRSMIEEGAGGKIVNIASVAGLHGAPAETMNSLPYHATQGRRHRPDARPRLEVGAAWDQRQRDCARLVPERHGELRDRQQPAAHRADPAARASAGPRI